MAYTQSVNKVLTPNSFKGLVVDGNRVALTGALGSGIYSQDAAASPLQSPLSNASGSGFALQVPQNAVQCTLYAASAVTLLVGEDSTYTYGMFVPTTTYFTVDCTRQQYIYVKPSSGTNTIYFQFKVV